MQVLDKDGVSPNSMAEKIRNPDAELVEKALKSVTSQEAVVQLTSPVKVVLEDAALIKQLAAVRIFLTYILALIFNESVTFSDFKIILFHSIFYFLRNFLMQFFVLVCFSFFQMKTKPRLLLTTDRHLLLGPLCRCVSLAHFFSQINLMAFSSISKLKITP